MRLRDAPSHGDSSLAAAAESFRHLVASGAGYLAARYGLGVLVSLGNMLVLTWWIGPHAYGLFVTAIGLIAFLASLGRAGVDTYLVRRRSAPDQRIYDIAGTVILCVSLGLVLVGAGLLPWLARWYGSREFVAPYLALLCNLPIVGLTGVPTAKLERELNFRTVAGIELGGQTIGLLFSFALAWAGMGVWAPVAGQIGWQAFLLIAAYRAARMLPRLRFERREAREMLSFGLGVSASMRAWQLRTLVNPLLVARFAGAEGAAFVGLAIRIAEALGSVRLAAGRLAIAGLARLQEHQTEFRRALERALFLQVMTLGPLLAAFALLGPLVVGEVIGLRWTPTLEIFPFIAAGVLVNSIYNLQASALFVIGEQWLVMRSYLAHAALLGVGTAWLLPRMGMVGYGWAELMACVAYLMIQNGMAKSSAISYHRLVPWVASFLALVFAPVLARLGIAGLSIGLTGAAAVWACMQASPLRRLCAAAANGVRGKARHLHTFCAKTRQRGWPYAKGVAMYIFRSRLYRCRLRLQSVIGLADGLRLSRGMPRTPSHGPVFHFSASDIPRIILSVPGPLKRKSIAEADAVLEHRFCFRGKERHFPGPVDWSAAPDGNISWQWDLNRHRFFLNLATSYYYTRDGSYLAKLVELWRDWIAENPVGKRETWRHPFEVAARLQNWIWAYFLVRYSGQAKADDLRRFEAAIQQHGAYLNSNLEHHWPNNHLLLEAKALYEYALLFPQHCGTGRYLARAGSVLQREVLAQILPDGAHTELCSMYHRILAGELSELAQVCRRNRRPLPVPIEQRMERVLEFSRALLREDGSMALLGDSAADDVQIRFDPAQQDCTDLNYWLRQPEEDAAEPVTSLPQLRIFPEAGYGFVRGGEGARRFHLTFDFGGFSHCTASNHGHCDALSFELYAGGRPLVIDPGVYLPWDDDGGWARYFRGTSAHNTLMVDGREQSELCAYADVQRRARTRLGGYSATEGSVRIQAECTPYWAAGEGIRHIREIFCDSRGSLRIRDAVQGAGVHRLEWFFHFALGIEVEESEGGLTGRLADLGTRVMELKVLGQPRPRMVLARGEDKPLRGWAARQSSDVAPTYTAGYSLDAALPVEISFCLEVIDAESPAFCLPGDSEATVCSDEMPVSASRMVLTCER